MNTGISSKKPAFFWRVVISIIGSFLVINAVLNMMLFVFGDTANAQIQTRRFGGSNDAYPASKRYEWSVMYEFVDNNGSRHSGYTKRRGGDLTVQVENKVYYFNFAPFISALEDEAVISLGQAVVAGIGCFLVYAVNGNPNKKLQ